MLISLLRALARIRVTVAYTAILACVTTAMMTAGAAGAEPDHQPCQHEPAQPQPRPPRHPVRQRVRHRRRAHLCLAARAGVPSGGRRADVAQRPACGGLRRRPYRRNAAGRGRAHRGRRTRLDVVGRDPCDRRRHELRRIRCARGVDGRDPAPVATRMDRLVDRRRRRGGRHREGLHRRRPRGGPRARHGGREPLRPGRRMEPGARVCCSSSVRRSDI